MVSVDLDATDVIVIIVVAIGLAYLSTVNAVVVGEVSVYDDELVDLCMSSIYVMPG